MVVVVLLDFAPLGVGLRQDFRRVIMDELDAKELDLVATTKLKYVGIRGNITDRQVCRRFPIRFVCATCIGQR